MKDDLRIGCFASFLRIQKQNLERKSFKLTHLVNFLTKHKMISNKTIVMNVYNMVSSKNLSLASFTIQKFDDVTSSNEFRCKVRCNCKKDQDF